MVPFVGLAVVTVWISTPSLSVVVRYLPSPPFFDYHNYVWLLMLLLTDPGLYLALDCLFGYRPIDSRLPPPHVMVPFVGLAVITLWISTPSPSVAVRYLPGPPS